MARHFRAIAPRYRELRELDARTVRRACAELERVAEETNRLAILDVGAGTGRYAEALVHCMSKHSGVRYRGVACDAIPEMLHAGPAPPPNDTAGVDHVIGFAEFLPFAAQSFSAVKCAISPRWVGLL